MISVSYLILLNKTSTHVRDFGIGKVCLWTRNFYCRIRDTVQGVRNPLTIWILNPISTDKESGIHYRKSGIQSVESKPPWMSWIIPFIHGTKNRQENLDLFRSGTSTLTSKSLLMILRVSKLSWKLAMFSYVRFLTCQDWARDMFSNLLKF